MFSLLTSTGPVTYTTHLDVDVTSAQLSFSVHDNDRMYRADSVLGCGRSWDTQCLDLNASLLYLWNGVAATYGIVMKSL